MSVQNEFSAYPEDKVHAFLSGCTRDRVLKTLGKRVLDFDDFLCLLSPVAGEVLSELATRAREETLRRFGRVIQFYAPVYLSNVCTNACLYCGFNHKNKIKRRTLTLTDVDREFYVLQESGLDNVLLLTGEAPTVVGLPYLEEAVSLAAAYFTFTGLEIYPLDENGYARLVAAGADGVTIYQETYNQEVYALMHPRGKKRDYGWRLETPTRALTGGVRKIGMGFLLGLADWRQEAVSLALHLRYLQKKFWKGEFTLSFPRIRETSKEFDVPSPVSDREFIQLICALRLLFPDVGFLLSTREAPSFRDRLLSLCVTQISAGSRTNPGGYSCADTEEQFSVADTRELAEMMELVSVLGYEPVLKDWDRVF